jgi:hypothetical protein
VNSRSRIIGAASNLLKVIGFMVFITLMAGAVFAQSSLKAAGFKAKATGEVVSASQTTINGFSAISGATVFNDNRITTGKHGAAVINLGRLGRIELGPETDLTLRLSESSIGGELRSNQVVVSARTGTSIAINTTEGIVTTDGRQPAVLTINVNGARARVITHIGDARLVSTGESRLAGAKESSQSPRGDVWRRAGMASGVIGAAGLGQTAAHAATATSNAPTFTKLFKAGIQYSIDPQLDRGAGAMESFETSITCRDNDKKACHRKSDYKPERP